MTPAARRQPPPRAMRQPTGPQRAQRERSAAEVRLGLRVAALEAESDILRGGLHAAAEILSEQDRLLGEVGVRLLLGQVASGDGAALEVARAILERLKNRAAIERVTDALADRLVLAEAALPALREAVEGTSRQRVRDAVEALAKALGGGAC